MAPSLRRSLAALAALTLLPSLGAAQPLGWLPASAGLPSGPAYALAAADTSGGVVAGTSGGPYWLRAGDPTWVLSDAPSEAVRRLTSAPGGRIYAAVDSALLRSDDGGRSWGRLPAPGHVGYTYGLAAAGRRGRPGGTSSSLSSKGTRAARPVAPVSSGTGPTTGAGRGRAWPVSPVVDFARDVVSTPSGALLVTEDEGVYRSEDGGATWDTVAVGERPAFDLQFSEFGGAAGPYVALYDRDDRLHLSADDGRTWSPTGVYGLSGGLALGADGALYVGLRVGTVFRGGEPGPIVYTGGVYRSGDGGRTWERTSFGLGLSSAGVNALAPYGGGVLAAAEAGPFWSGDGGVTWAPLGEGLRSQLALDLAFGPDGAAYASTYPRRLHRLGRPRRGGGAVGARPAPPVRPPASSTTGRPGGSRRPGSGKWPSVPTGPSTPSTGTSSGSARARRSGRPGPSGSCCPTSSSSPTGRSSRAPSSRASTGAGTGATRGAGSAGGSRTRGPSRPSSRSPTGRCWPAGSGRRTGSTPATRSGVQVGTGLDRVLDLAADDRGHVYAGYEEWVEVVYGQSADGRRGAVGEAPLTADEVALGPDGTALVRSERDGLTQLVHGGGARSPSPLPAYTATGRGGVLRSADGGRTWERVGPPSGPVRAVAVDGAGRVHAGPLVSADGGEAWGPVGAGLRGEGVTALAASPSGGVWAGTHGGGVYRPARSVVTNEAPAPDGAGAFAVWPNPARGTATAALSLAVPCPHVEVSVYDVVGRRVLVAHSGALPAGRHAVALDLRGLPAGVYVVRASGDRLRLAGPVAVVR